MHFISPSAPDTCQKLQKLEAGPQSSPDELANLAFSVFNTREEEKAQKEREKEETKARYLNQAYQLLVLALKETQDFPRQKGKTFRGPVSGLGKLGIGPMSKPLIPSGAVPTVQNRRPLEVQLPLGRSRQGTIGSPLRADPWF